MGTNTLLDNIPTYSVLDFPQTKAAPTIKGNPQRVRHLGNFGKLNLSISLSRSPVGEGGGGTPLYGLYRYVRPQKVLFFSRFGLK